MVDLTKGNSPMQDYGSKGGNIRNDQEKGPTNNYRGGVGTQVKPRSIVGRKVAIWYWSGR